MISLNVPLPHCCLQIEWATLHAGTIQNCFFCTSYGSFHHRIECSGSEVELDACGTKSEALLNVNTLQKRVSRAWILCHTGHRI